MSMFKKSGLGLIDYTELTRRGLIKKQDQTSLPIDAKTGMIDLTKMPIHSSSAQKSPLPSQQSPQGEPGNIFNILDNPTPTINPPPSIFDNPSPSPPSFPHADHSDVSAMRIKIDDLEFKLERLLDNLALIESKLEQFEKKTS